MPPSPTGSERTTHLSSISSFGSNPTNSSGSDPSSPRTAARKSSASAGLASGFSESAAPKVSRHRGGTASDATLGTGSAPAKRTDPILASDHTSDRLSAAAGSSCTSGGTYSPSSSSARYFVIV